VLNLSRTHLLKGYQQFFLSGFVVRDLILRYVYHHNTDVKFGDILLELQTAVDR